MRKLTILIVTILLSMNIPAFSLLEKGSDAPDFELIDVSSGETYKLSDFLGHVVLIDFFSLSCTYCRLHSEFFEGIYQDYKDQNFMIFAVDFDPFDDEDGIFNYALKYNWTFPVFFDFQGTVPSLYDYDGYMPTTFIVGRDGKIFISDSGYHEEPVFRNWIEDALNQQEEKLGISVSTDKTEYTINDTLEVYLSLTNPGDKLDADIIFAFGRIDIDSGVYLWFFPEWSLTFKPISLQIPSGFKATNAKIIQTTVSSLGTPPITVTGDYFFITALALPSFPNIIYPISISQFKVIE